MAYELVKELCQLTQQCGSFFPPPCDDDPLWKLSLAMDEFEYVHEMIRKDSYEEALNTLLDRRKWHLKQPYKLDGNHAWYLVGDVYYREQQYFLALKAFKRAIKHRRDDAQALWAIGNTYTELKRPVLAERYFRRALVHDKDNANLIYNLGNALFDQGDYQGAIELYQKIGRSEEHVYEFAQNNIKAAKEKAKRYR